LLHIGPADMPQSALATAGRDAERIADLFVVMTSGALLVWVVVVATAVYAIRHRDKPHSQRTAGLFIIGGGVALPTLVLAALLVYGLPVLPALLAPGTAALPGIDVSAKQWWWRMRYLTARGVIETANELRLPVGHRAEIRLASSDVIHSFWVPPIAGKVDMIPGRTTRIAMEPTRTGTFRGVCAEYCGASHALMAFAVVVVEPDDFEAWLAHQMRPAETPSGALASQGQSQFIANGCGACHTVRGTAADGRVGPDLTHVGSRPRIGAGTLGNEPDAVLRWIADTDVVKPGVHMPAFRALPPQTLSALAAYLDGLK
jgi:cytochrome c oxidase subunit 2